MFLRTTIYCDTSIQIYLISSHDFKYSSIWQWNWLFQKRHIVSDNMTDVFLMVRRLKSTFFLMCKEKDTVAVVKRMLAGIVKKELEEIRIYQQRENLESGKNWFEEKDGKEILLKNLFCLRVGWLCQPWISGLFSDQLQASVTWGHGRRLEGGDAGGEHWTASKAQLLFTKAAPTCSACDSHLPVTPYTAAPALPDVMKPLNMEAEEASAMV